MKLFENGDYSFELSPDGGELFTDLSAEHRGGHLGHAMTQRDDGKIICFNANCSGIPLDGHSGDGWMDYKIIDSDGTLVEGVKPFPYSKTMYDLNIGTTSMCEKAVTAPDGGIVVFNLICELTDGRGKAWEPFSIPTYVKSTDGGKSYGKAKKLGCERARVYDACVHDGIIYVLSQYSLNPTTCLRSEYHLFTSSDNGETFTDRSILPFFPTYACSRYYGTMEWLDGNTLIAYSYRDAADERYQSYAISHDCGKTWGADETAFFDKKIRNMQMVKLENSYFMFGRSGNPRGVEDDTEHGHIIAYASSDGINWNEGVIIKRRTAGIGAYSNTLLVTAKDGSKRVLYQSSHAYEKNRTNIYHWWIDCKKLK